jgi:hypothetical protein
MTPNSMYEHGHGSDSRGKGNSGNSTFDYDIDPDRLGLDEDQLAFVAALARKLLQDKSSSEKKLARTLAGISANQRSYSSYSPEVRRKGLFGRNSEDLKRADAAKAIEDLYVLLARIAANSGKMVTGVHEINATAAEYMDIRVNELPDHLQPQSRVVSYALSDLQATVGVEIASMFTEISQRIVTRLYNQYYH